MGQNVDLVDPQQARQLNLVTTPVTETQNRKDTNKNYSQAAYQSQNLNPFPHDNPPINKNTAYEQLPNHNDDSIIHHNNNNDVTGVALSENEAANAEELHSIHTELYPEKAPQVFSNVKVKSSSNSKYRFTPLKPG